MGERGRPLTPQTPAIPPPVGLRRSACHACDLKVELKGDVVASRLQSIHDVGLIWRRTMWGVSGGQQCPSWRSPSRSKVISDLAGLVELRGIVKTVYTSMISPRLKHGIHEIRRSSESFFLSIENRTEHGNVEDRSQRPPTRVAFPAGWRPDVQCRRQVPTSGRIG